MKSCTPFGLLELCTGSHIILISKSARLVRLYPPYELTIARAAALHIPPIDIHASSATISKLCRLAHLSLEDLQKYGEIVRERGYLRKRGLKSYQYTHGRFQDVFRQIPPDWSKIDGTLPQGSEEMERRYQYGPPYSNSSCAIDCVVFVAVMLDLGRVQIDQVCSSMLKNMSGSAYLIYAMVRGPWATLSPAQRSRLRDNLRAAVLKERPSLVSPQSNHLPVGDVLDHCLQHPQLGWHQVPARFCPTTRHSISPTVMVQRHYSLFVESPPLVDALDGYFIDRWEVPGPESACSDADCQERHIRRYVVLDRLPPTLMIHFQEPPTPQTLPLWRLDQPIMIEHTLVTGPEFATYYVVGCIWHEGTGASSHFTVVWRTPNKSSGPFVVFDGLLRGGRVEPTSSWTAGKKRGISLNTAILRMAPDLESSSPEY